MVDILILAGSIAMAYEIRGSHDTRRSTEVDYGVVEHQLAVHSRDVGFERDLLEAEELRRSSEEDGK